jgi:hypothetical protein
MVTLSLPAGHNVPRGTVLRLEQGPDVGMEEMCRICPTCRSCGGSAGMNKGGNFNARGKAALCNT